MKLAGLSTKELAAVVCDALERRGITAVLTGGACVMIYARGKYVSKDLDFVVASQDRLEDVAAALAGLSFRARGRVYVSAQTNLVIDVGNPWPPAVGRQILKLPAARLVARHRLRMLSPTDCVKDRLAAFHYWDDRQALEQAILVCRARKVDIKEVGRWSRAEGQSARFAQFRGEFKR